MLQVGKILEEGSIEKLKEHLNKHFIISDGKYNMYSDIELQTIVIIDFYKIILHYPVLKKGLQNNSS